MNDSTLNQARLRQRLIVSVSLVLLSGLIVSALYLYFSTSQQALLETRKLGKSFSQQSTTLIRPLLLSNDRISLNYLLNELSTLEYISGVEVLDHKGMVLARAGKMDGNRLQHSMHQQETVLGTLNLWLNSKPAVELLRSQLKPLLVVTLGTIIFCLIVIWSMLRPQPQNTLRQRQTPVRQQQEATPVKFTIAERESAPSPLPEQKDEQEESANNRPEQITASDINDGFSATLRALQTQTTHDQVTAAAEGKEHSSQLATPLTAEKDEHETSADDSPPATTEPLQTQSLVDLLKPEQQSQPQMPRFEHHPQELSKTEDETVPEDEFVVEEEEIEPTLEAENEPATSSSAEPLISELVKRDEVQLDLYSFEHELELILPPAEAIYLFYIDSTTASSENTEAEVRQQLLQVYLKMAHQAAQIYGGQVTEKENGDFIVHFEQREESDNHGINALCSAMLFTLLYRGFNHSRISSFKPVLNLQMALARGHHSRESLISEEAHFLTRTTHSNELISHTALSEAPQLKEAMLDDADIRREDEDKVLIMKVTPQHQQLLQKQANHLLSKMFGLKNR